MSRHENAPTRRGPIHFESDAITHHCGIQFGSGVGAEHDVIIHNRVVHRQDHELVRDLDADAPEGAPAQQDVALGAVDDLQSLTRHRVTIPAPISTDSGARP
jgi:hypothetical protein